MDILYQSSRNTLQTYYTYIGNHYEHSAATYNHFYRTPLLCQKLSQNKLYSLFVMLTWKWGQYTCPRNVWVRTLSDKVQYTRRTKIATKSLRKPDNSPNISKLEKAKLLPDNKSDTSFYLVW